MKQMKISYHLLLLLLGISFLLQELAALDSGGAAAKCGKRAEPGPCKGSVPRWYWNRWEHRCLMFTYGGCKGNDNNFESLEDCRDACKDVLLLNDDDNSDELAVQPPPSSPEAEIFPINPEPEKASSNPEPEIAPSNPEPEISPPTPVSEIIIPKRSQPKKKIIPKTVIKPSKKISKKPKPPASNSKAKKPQPPKPNIQGKKPHPPKPNPKGKKQKPPTSKKPIISKNKVKKAPGPSHVPLKPKNIQIPKEKIEVDDTLEPGKSSASFWKCVRRGKKMSCVEDPSPVVGRSKTSPSKKRV